MEFKGGQTGRISGCWLSMPSAMAASCSICNARLGIIIHEPESIINSAAAPENRHLASIEFVGVFYIIIQVLQPRAESLRNARTCAEALFVCSSATDGLISKK